MPASRRIVAAFAVAAVLALQPGGADAHPHVWVTVEATVPYENGTITGLQEEWTFDEFYTQQAIEGLDANRDGKYDRQELAELAKVNIDGLKEFNYFTYAKLGAGDLKFKPPVDYWLEHTDKGILKLHFTLPLEQPVQANTDGFTFQVHDPSYFIAFDLAKDNPVKLGARAGRLRGGGQRARRGGRQPDATAQPRLLQRPRRRRCHLRRSTKTVAVRCHKS